MFVGGALYSAASSMVEAATGYRTVASRHAAQVASLLNDLELERREKAKLQRRLDSASAKVKNTADRVTKRTSWSAARDIASMPGEAIPWVVMAVIAGVTVLEVNDLCATLEDMNELTLAFDPTAERDEEA
jgi:tetrahydromethanopterin S-methyltransferase subunit G